MNYNLLLASIDDGSDEEVKPKMEVRDAADVF